MASKNTPNKLLLPGRLGDDKRRSVTDPRLDGRMRTLYQRTGMGVGSPSDYPLTRHNTYEERLAAAAEMETILPAMLMSGLEMPMSDNALDYGLGGLDITTYKIKGYRASDTHEIELTVRRPKKKKEGVDDKKLLPCMLHIHGGGMAVLSAQDPVVVRGAALLAQAGAIVVTVEFRNAGGKLGPHPFPAGLEDCCAAATWIAAHRDDPDTLVGGYTALVVTGESGGGNLSIATTMKLMKDKSTAKVDGVFAMCPYISNAYHLPVEETGLVSIKENDDFFLSTESMAVLASVYCTSPEDERNPLAWPLQATTDDLRGLPPFMISVNELDPLRDEGKAFYHKLVAAGVPCVCHMVCGTEHGMDLIGAHIHPDIAQATFRSIVAFANSLAAA